MKTEFRKIRDDELDASYQVIVDATEWLLSKGIRQWLAPLPRDIWDKRQDSGQNFGLFCDGELAVVLSLYTEVHAKWKTELGCDSQWWLNTLATAAPFRSNGLGRRGVAEAEAYLKDMGVQHLCIDCVASGFLPGFYTSLGFEFLARIDIKHTLGTFDAALMRKGL